MTRVFGDTRFSERGSLETRSSGRGGEKGALGRPRQLQRVRRSAGAGTKLALGGSCGSWLDHRSPLVEKWDFQAAGLPVFVRAGVRHTLAIEPAFA